MLFALINSLFILPDQKYIAHKKGIKYGYDIISQLLPMLSMTMRLQTEVSEVQWFLEQTFFWNCYEILDAKCAIFRAVPRLDPHRHLTWMLLEEI